MKPKPDAPPFVFSYRVACPECGAEIGWRCKDGSYIGLHDARIAAAMAEYQRIRHS